MNQWTITGKKDRHLRKKPGIANIHPLEFLVDNRIDPARLNETRRGIFCGKVVGNKKNQMVDNEK